MAAKYTYRISWSSSENQYLATVVEFPSLSWIADDREEALTSLTSLVGQVLKDMGNSGEEIPKPWDQREFSGRFNLRLGPDLHRKVALLAAERHESLNSYVVKQLM